MSEEKEATKEEVQELIGGIAARMKDFEENVVFLGEKDALPLTVEIKSISSRGRSPMRVTTVGQPVACRPCFEEAQGKTYLGFYLGDLVCSGVDAAFHKVNGELMLMQRTNPAMFVPDLNRVVWGYESWWGPIKSPADLKKITDADISDVWYVKALEDLAAAEAAKSESPPSGN